MSRVRGTNTIIGNLTPEHTAVHRLISSGISFL